VIFQKDPWQADRAGVMSAPKSRRPVAIGWAELVDIPEWNIARLRAKMDTGARTSALHVENIEEVSEDLVRFDVRLHRKNLARRVTVEAPIVRRADVRSSSGVAEKRIFVRANVHIGEFAQEIELSLVSRERMLFRMLIGRSALRHRFLIDPSRRYVLREPKRKKKS
jgi:hypothetical protein